MFGRNYFGGPTFGGVRPTARLAGRPKLGQQSGLSCCNAPNGQSYCFDTGSGECIMTWVSSATGSPDTPACVQDSQGQWVLPSCVGQEGQPSGGRPPLPPGCTYAGHESNNPQEVICECYNCTTRQSDGWRGLLSAFIAMGSQNPCLRSSEWFPKPAQCPSGPGGGGSYSPPAPSQPAPTAPVPSPAPSSPYPLPDQSGLTSANRVFCGPSGGPFTIVEVDPVTAEPIRVVARDVAFGDPNYEWAGVVNNPPWCADFLASDSTPPADSPTSPGTPAPPVMPPQGTPPQGTLPPYYGGPSAGPYPTSPGQVRIQPSPFGGGSVVPRQVPIAPARRGMPTQRSTFSSCPATTPPVRVRQLRSQTSQARPDNFPEPLWTTF